MAIKHDCNQGDRILKLEIEKEQMSKDIQEIKDTAHETQKTVKELNDTMQAWILTAPQKFADKKQTEDFQKSIDSKIAYISGAWAVIVTVVGFVANKYF